MANDKTSRSSANASTPEKVSPSDAVKASRERMKSKYPDLFPGLAKLEKEIEKIEAKTAPMRKRLEKLHERLQPLLAEERDLAEEINAIERPTLGEKKTALAALYRAMGAGTVSATSGE